MPRHVAIIMDGNGRWAQERKLPRHSGHEAGVESVRVIVNACLQRQIPILSLFAFSRENWQRPSEEVSLLMALFIEALTQEQERLCTLGVRLRFIGSREQLSPDLVHAIEETEAMLPADERLQLVIALDYSGRWDLAQAAQRYAQDVKAGVHSADHVNEHDFAQYLCLSDSPDPDLFIRTSGEQRISNFFLWQMAYTELYFAPVFWPEFRETALDTALEWFSERERRFGKTSKQIQESPDA